MSLENDNKKPDVKLIPTERIVSRIFLIRGMKVLLDQDLAKLYGIETKNLNKAVKRNLDRFPDDFMFQLTQSEHESLRFQFGTSKTSRGGRRYLPYVFTEQGVAMLSSVLKSKQAVQVNIQIVRTFIQLREMLMTHKDLREKIEAMEKRYDKQFKAVFDAIKQLVVQEEQPKREIGFCDKSRKIDK